MTTPTLTFEHTGPDLGDDPPFPDGATNYERQELRLAWRNALSYYADLAGYAAQGFRAVAETNSLYLREANNNAAQRLVQAQMAHERYRTLLDGIHHRLAMEERAEALEAASGQIVHLVDKIQEHSAGKVDLENGHQAEIAPGFYLLTAVERDEAHKAWKDEEVR